MNFSKNFNLICVSVTHIIFASSYIVDLDQGKLQGTSGLTVFDKNLYFAFYRVPYAKPPIGELRFKNPQLIKKWKKTLDARTEYHGACAQAHIVHKHGLYGAEDCLYLNIFSPSLYKTGKTKLKAVIVWIHGYAFTSSFSHVHGPDFFIDEDVILVTVSHRIGAFGFLKLNETDRHANMGLKDIVMALKWVRNNIKKFGGDNTRVTAMGSGSAATFLSIIMTTKFNKYFSKVILQSGGIFSPSLFQDIHVLEKDRLLERLQREGLKDIHAASTKDIVAVSQNIYSNKDVINSQRSMVPFLPVLEIESKYSLLTNHPEDSLSDERDVLNNPIMIGFNSKESISEIIPFLHNPRYLRSFTSYFKYLVPFSSKCTYHYTNPAYQQIASKIRNEYFPNGISEKSVEDFIRYSSDLLKYPIYSFIQALLKLKARKLYAYKFTYGGSFNVVKANSISGINKVIKGAASGDEICYMLKCEPYWESYVNINRNSSSTDRIFIKKITKLWANFAKTGDPTPNTFNGLTWPLMTEHDDKMLNLGKSFNITSSKKEKKLFDFWNDIYRNYYKDCGVHDEL